MPNLIRLIIKLDCAATLQRGNHGITEAFLFRLAALTGATGQPVHDGGQPRAVAFIAGLFGKSGLGGGKRSLNNAEVGSRVVYLDDANKFGNFCRIDATLREQA